MNEITINNEIYILIKKSEYSSQNNLGSSNLGDNNIGHGNSGHDNSGNYNSGDCNSGDNNLGDYNLGSHNLGNNNPGNCNSGSHNSGNNNFGYNNFGDNNLGDNNSGDCNLGNYNLGNCNLGSHNLGDCNFGMLNTNTPLWRIFNKETTFKVYEIDIPRFFILVTVIFITAENMTEQEKFNYPKYEITNGYLKKIGYKEAWRASWEKADNEDKKKVLLLPNFDNEIFKEISGIDVALELNLIKQK